MAISAAIHDLSRAGDADGALLAESTVSEVWVGVLWDPVWGVAS